uniref:Glycohydro_20b2 domain-containing protein n=1 Tax=Steinernema glaseri TaxID=37863 RepID=A0A1I8A8I2_9BILA
MRGLLLFVVLWTAAEGEHWFYGRPRPDATSQGGVWPLPQRIEYGEHNRTIDPSNFDIEFDDNTGCDYLRNLEKTYKRWLFPFKKAAVHSGADEFILEIKLKKKCPRDRKVPPSDMNEHYTLTVKETGKAVLEADEIWGALRGFETFSHLIWFCNKCQKIRSLLRKRERRFSKPTKSGEPFVDLRRSATLSGSAASVKSTVSAQQK